MTIYYKSQSRQMVVLSIFSGYVFLCQQYQLFFHWHLFFYVISNNNCRLLTINIVYFIFFLLSGIQAAILFTLRKKQSGEHRLSKDKLTKPRLHKRLYPIRVQDFQLCKSYKNYICIYSIVHIIGMIIFLLQMYFRTNNCLNYWTF